MKRRAGQIGMAKINAADFRFVEMGAAEVRSDSPLAGQRQLRKRGETVRCGVGTTHVGPA
jgi:hypothetical protein